MIVSSALQGEQADCCCCSSIATAAVAAVKHISKRMVGHMYLTGLAFRPCSTLQRSRA